MSFLSVSSKKTRVHLSPENLSSIVSEYTNSQQDDFVSDIAILPIYKSFIQIIKSSKDSWINICKIKKEDDDKEIIKVCVKNKAENLSAIAASKKKGSGLCFASGYNNGKIKIRDIQTNSVIKEFSAPLSSSSVYFMDFNNSDEHLASVFEDGLINIYGLQTSIKLHSFTLDNQSNLARFHPQKKSHLGVASYSGKVSIIDIYTKKTIFKDDGHSAPCSDIALTEDFLLSSGYDSIIKIYDLRKKSPALQIQACYGWTSISTLGVYFVGGNMKGELISYDMRNIKKPLSSARIESSNHKISRVAFLSDEMDSSSVDISKAVRESLCKFEEEVDGKSKINEGNDDFIGDILGFQRGRISDFSSSAINYGTRVSTTSCRSSTDLRLDDMKNIHDFSSPQSSGANLDDSRVNKSRRRMSTKDTNKVRPSIGFRLHEIDEENNDKENDSKCVNTPDAPTTPSIVTPRYSSTPMLPVAESNNENAATNEKEIETIEVDCDDSFKSVQNGQEILKETRSVDTLTRASSISFDFRKEFDALAEKIHIEIGSMNLDQNMRHIELMYHVADQRRQLQNRVQMIEESLAILMNDDFKINLINELQAENQELRQKVNELTRRFSH